MASSAAWAAIVVAVLLLVLVALLLFRVLRQGQPAAKPTSSTAYVPTTPDETMIISREQADEILNKHRAG